MVDGRVEHRILGEHIAERLRVAAAGGLTGELLRGGDRRQREERKADSCRGARLLTRAAMVVRRSHAITLALPAARAKSGQADGA